jgi:hypothetical protein
MLHPSVGKLISFWYDIIVFTLQKK